MTDVTTRQPAQYWRDRVLAHLEAHGPCTPRVLVAATGCQPGNLRRVLRPLMASGAVVSKGATSLARYALPGQIVPVAPPRLLKPKSRPGPQPRVDAREAFVAVRDFLSQQSGPVTFAETVLACRVRRTVVREALAELVEAGLVRRTGARQWLRFRWIREGMTPIAGSDMRVPRHRELRGIPLPGAEVLEELRTMRPQVVRALHGLVDGMPFGKLVGLMGGVSHSKLRLVLDGMIADRCLARITQLGVTKFRLPLAGEDLLPGPPVRWIPVPPFDRDRLARIVWTILESGVSVDVNELVTKARPFDVHATRETVTDVLEPMVRQGSVTLLLLGAFVRYRRQVSA